MNPHSLLAILPLICVGAGAVLVMLLVAVRRTYTGAAVLSLIGLGAALVTLPFMANATTHRLFLLRINGFTVLYTGLLVLAAAAAILLTFGYLKKYEHNREEFFILMLLATLGAIVLAASDHFATFFLGLELLSVSLYALSPTPHDPGPYRGRNQIPDPGLGVVGFPAFWHVFNLCLVRGKWKSAASATILGPSASYRIPMDDRRAFHDGRGNRF